MIPFPIHEILSACGGQFYGDPWLLSQCCSGISINSRNVTDGMLYIPVIGERFDGHSFIPDARSRGALCVLTDRMLPEQPFIMVPNVLHALQDIAHVYRNRFSIPVIGVTGSVGKTSTKEMIASALSSRLCVLKTEGSLNNQTGVPQILFRLDPSHQAAIIEMGTNHPGEIDSLARMTEPTICLFTNIGVAHIEFFGSREGIFRGKTEMIPWMRPGDTIIANGDDEFLKDIRGAVLFGTGTNCSVRAEKISDLGLNGISYHVCTPAGNFPIHVPQPGTGGLYNSLGINLGDLACGIASYVPPSGRLYVRRTKSLTILDDAYNANPDSMRASIDVLEKVNGRRICILGDMLELGRDSSVYHSEIGVYAANHGADIILCLGPDSRYICDGANSVRSGIAYHYCDRKELIACLSKVLLPGDTVLVKASRGIHLEEIVSELLDLSLSCNSSFAYKQ